MIALVEEGFHIIHNDEEAHNIIDAYWGNGKAEITREQIQHLLDGGKLIEVINQEYTSEITLKK